MSEASSKGVASSPEKKLPEEGKDSAWKQPGGKLYSAYQAKLDAQEKLDACFKELYEAFSRTKQAFVSYKTKSFFFPDQELTKKCSEYMKQVEGNLLDMGNALSIWDKKKSAVKTSGIKSEDNSDSTNQTPQHNGPVKKDDAAVSITPPASETGNDDEISIPGFETSSALEKKAAASKRQQTGQTSEKKRRHRKSDIPQAEKGSKRPRRSLIDDYLMATDSDTNKAVDDKKESDGESEYEVETIVGFKKSLGQYYYNVSWRGYGPEDNTWEPSENLTSCEELLVEFYKTRLKLRETLSDEDFASFAMPNDAYTRRLQREALLIMACEPDRQDLSRTLPLVLSSKSGAQKTQLEMNEYADKVLVPKKKEKYMKLMQTLVDYVMLKEVESKRKKQLAELRMWERKINSVCNDPAKIYVENDVDLELPAMDFVYINELRAGAGVTVPSDPVLGCECEDCFSNSTSCCPHQMNSWFAYNKYGRLKVSLGTPIYECNKRCKCSSNCSNRVVQKGRKVSLSIFRTPNSRGWGVKAMENIKKDTFVTEYVGEVITSEEAERRGQIYDAQGCTYLFDLDYDKGDQNLYTVDAARYGNVSHFINHSCDPNLVVFNVWVNCLDPDLPRLALFSVRDIKKGEELTFDYNSGLGSQQMANGEVPESEGADFMTPQKTEGSSSAPVSSPDMILKTPKGNRGLQYGKTECLCGAANCRKYFF